jgi:prevent-host-death family protein
MTVEHPAEMSISDARDDLADIVSRAHHADRITYVSRRGKRVAAIVPAALTEALERAVSVAGVAGVHQALARVAAGEPSSVDDHRRD